MDDLLEWLTGCLDHLADTAAMATVGPWEWTGEPCWTPATDECASHKHDWGHYGPDLHGHDGDTVVTSSGYDADSVLVSRPDATHIALHDPQAVLARVQAEVVLVALHRPEEQGIDNGVAGGESIRVCDECQPWGTNDLAPYPCATIRILAWGHRFDFPGYRENLWAPEGASSG